MIDDDDEDETAKNDEFAAMSRFEREQKKLQEQIRQLESFNISDKPWQLIGGASVTSIE